MPPSPLLPPVEGDTWVALSTAPLPLEAASSWVVEPRCGATVTFTGTARDHAPGRPGVERLDYEAYEEHAVPKMAAVVAAARQRWPGLGRVVLLHRTGTVLVTEAAVVVAVAAPHRPDAFEAARFVIDEVKRTVPIWKLEVWAGGESWGLACEDHGPASSGAR